MVGPLIAPYADGPMDGLTGDPPKPLVGQTKDQGPTRAQRPAARYTPPSNATLWVWPSSFDDVFTTRPPPAICITSGAVTCTVC